MHIVPSHAQLQSQMQTQGQQTQHKREEVSGWAQNSACPESSLTYGKTGAQFPPSGHSVLPEGYLSGQM